MDQEQFVKWQPLRKVEVIDHITLDFLKADFCRLHLVHSWIHSYFLLCYELWPSHSRLSRSCSTCYVKVILNQKHNKKWRLVPKHHRHLIKIFLERLKRFQNICSSSFFTSNLKACVCYFLSDFYFFTKW